MSRENLGQVLPAFLVVRKRRRFYPSWPLGSNFQPQGDRVHLRLRSIQKSDLDFEIRIPS